MSNISLFQKHKSEHNFTYLQKKLYVFNNIYIFRLGARGGVVGWGTTLQTGKVAGSIPNGVTGNFQWHNPSGRTMALGSTQPVTEMSTRCILWG
jgi:hypothetical protein